LTTVVDVEFAAEQQWSTVVQSESAVSCRTCFSSQQWQSFIVSCY